MSGDTEIAKSAAPDPSADDEKTAGEGRVTRLIGGFVGHWLELTGVVLALGSFAGLLILIAVSFLPDPREIGLFLGFRSLLTTASIGIIAVIAARKIDKLIATLAIVIVAVVFVSVDDLVTLFATVSGREVPANLPSRRTNTADIGANKADFSGTAQQITALVEERMFRDADIADPILQSRIRSLGEEIRRIIENAELEAIAGRISDTGADELLWEIHNEEFVVSYLRYKDMPQFSTDLDLLRFEGLIDDRYGDIPETVASTDFGCLVLDKLRSEDLQCRQQQDSGRLPTDIASDQTIRVDEQQVIPVSERPATLRLRLDTQAYLQIEATPELGFELDPYLEVFRDGDGDPELLYSDDDGGIGLNALLTETLPAADYILKIQDFNGQSGRIIVSVIELAGRNLAMSRETLSLPAGRRDPISELVLVAGNEGAELLLDVSGTEGAERLVRIEATSDRLDSQIKVYAIDRPESPARAERLLAENDDRSDESFDACLELMLESGQYLLQIADYFTLTGEVRVSVSNAGLNPADEACETIERVATNR